MEKVLATCVYYLGTSADEPSIKSGGLVRDGFSQQSSEESSVFFISLSVGQTPSSEVQGVIDLQMAMESIGFYLTANRVPRQN